MTDKEHEIIKARIQKLIDKWYHTLGLGWYRTDMVWARDHDEEKRDTAARTKWSWQYRTAEITWFLPVCMNQNDEELERIVVHEFAHILTGSMAQNAPDTDEYSQMMEYGTETVARSLMWARNAGRDDLLAEQKREAAKKRRASKKK